MNVPKLVSFIIPVYNAEKSLTTCVQSILGQTYNSIEIILINDGSTDNSKELCNKLAEVYPAIHVIHQKNSGVSAARNAGIKKANGIYIQFVDADDYLDSMMTKKLVNIMNTNINCELVICGYEAISTRGIKKYTSSIEGMFKEDTYLTHFGDLYKRVIIPSPCNKLYLADVINRYQIIFTNSLSIGEDLLFNLSYLRHCKHIYINNDPLYKYVTDNEHSLSRGFRNNYLEEQQRLLEEVTRFLRERNALNLTNEQKLGEIYANSIINALTNLFHPDNPLPRSKTFEKMNDILNAAKQNIDIQHFRGTYQKRLVRTLLRCKASYGLYAFFRMKPYLQEQQRILTTLLKKFKHE